MEYALSPLNRGLRPSTTKNILLFSEIQEMK